MHNALVHAMYWNVRSYYVQGVVTAIVLYFHLRWRFYGNFDPIRYTLTEKGRDRLCTLVCASVYYMKPSDQEVEKLD